MAHNTIANIVYETCEAIWNIFCLKHMAIPTTDDFYKIANEFEQLWNFPNCVGCLDGKHLRIKCPNNSGYQFYNYKKYFSIHLQGIADANYKFITVDKEHMEDKVTVEYLLQLMYIIVWKPIHSIYQQTEKYQIQMIFFLLFFWAIKGIL